MSAKERERKVEFESVGEGRMTIVDAAEKLGLSYRHSRRSYKPFREQWDVGLVHRSYGISVGDGEVARGRPLKSALCAAA